MRRDRVRIKFAVPLVVFGVIGFAVIVAIQMLHGRTVVERFLSEATSLQLRVAGMGEVQGLAARYRDHVTTACDSEGCAYTFGFDNGWLRRLRLAPYTRLTCTLGVSGGLLVHRRLVMISGNNSGPFGAFVEEWLSYPRGLEMLVKPFDARRQPAGTRADIRWRIHVFLLADATPDQHRIACLEISFLGQVN